jgi:hypothetical protein
MRREEMDEKTYTKKIHEALSRLSLPYYRPHDITLKYYSSMATTYLDFCLPFMSIINLIAFCKVNNMSLSFNNGRAELCQYHPKDVKKFTIPKINQE